MGSLLQEYKMKFFAVLFAFAVAQEATEEAAAEERSMYLPDSALAAIFAGASDAFLEAVASGNPSVVPNADPNFVSAGSEEVVESVSIPSLDLGALFADAVVVEEAASSSSASSADTACEDAMAELDSSTNILEELSLKSACEAACMDVEDADCGAFFNSVSFL